MINAYTIFLNASSALNLLDAIQFKQKDCFHNHVCALRNQNIVKAFKLQAFLDSLKRVKGFDRCQCLAGAKGQVSKFRRYLKL